MQRDYLLLLVGPGARAFGFGFSAMLLGTAVVPSSSRRRWSGRPAGGALTGFSITHHSGLAVAAGTLTMPGAAGEEGLLLWPPGAIDLRDRPPDGHTGTFGTLVVLAGSLGMTGVAYLSATAAARSGAGIVKLLVADSIYPILAATCTEVMTTPVPEVARGAIGHFAHEALARHARIERPGEQVRRQVKAGAAERLPHPLLGGEVEDSADVEKDWPDHRARKR